MVKPMERNEQAQQERRRIAVLCVDVAFAHTHIPSAIVETVCDLAARYGVEAAVEVSAVVVRAFEFGRSVGYYREK